MLLIAFVLTMISLSAITSYIFRKPKSSWSIPKAPEQFKVGYGITILLIALSIALPLFGVSMMVIILTTFLFGRKNGRINTVAID